MHDSTSAPSATDLEYATDAALECLEWSESQCDENGDNAVPLDSLGLFFDEESRARIRAELGDFISANNEDLEGLDYSQIGHDFILTRNHHGAGFWDRGLGERGERLTESAHDFGGITAFVLDGDLHAEDS